MSGFSIPATEHSVITAFGPGNEKEAFAQFLNAFPAGTIACVSDTYNIFDAVEHLWGGVFREQILSRDGRLVIRPDSGDPFEVVPELLEIMGDRFGYTVNQKGYRVLDPHVRLIQGDGMNRETIPQLYARIRNFGWSAENLVVGSGGALLQSVNRDTCKFAIKASQAKVDGQPLDIAKTPVTDSGKRSKRGRLKLVFNEQSTFETVSSAEERERWADSIDQLVPVFVDGEIVTNYLISNIRARLRSFEGA
jgi:nicotinamide phosphoribosyltransferase